MARQQRGSTRIRELAQHPANPADAIGIHAVYRLVEDQGCGIAEQCRTDPESLAHAIDVTTTEPGGVNPVIIRGVADLPPRWDRGNR